MLLMEPVEMVILVKCCLVAQGLLTTTAALVSRPPSGLKRVVKVDGNLNKSNNGDLLVCERRNSHFH